MQTWTAFGDRLVEALVPADDGIAEEDKGHRASGEEGSKWDVLLSATRAEGYEDDSDDGAEKEAGKQPARELRPGQIREVQAKNRRQPDIAETHASRRNQMDHEEDREC